MPKPLRKTRRQDPTSLDRLSRLSEELRKVLNLSQVTLQREQTKLADIAEARNVCDARIQLIEIKKKAISGPGGSWLAGVNDDELFAEKERTVAAGRIGAAKRMIIDTHAQTGQIIKLRRVHNDVPAPPAATGGFGVSNGMLPTQLYNTMMRKLADMQNVLDREVAKKRDNHWEDITDNAYQPPAIPFSLRHFRIVPSVSPSPPNELKSPLFSSPTPSSSSSSRGPSPPASRSGMPLRLRVGRGGRMLLDRRIPRNSNHPVDSRASESVPPPLNQELPMSRTSTVGRKYSSVKPGNSGMADAVTTGFLSRLSVKGAACANEEDKELAWKVDERWKFDCEAGLPVGGACLAERIGESQDDPRLVVDDYEHNTFPIRKLLLHEDDFSVVLRTDEAHLRRADVYAEDRREDERVFAREALAKAAITRREMAARQPPPPPPPPTPNGVAGTVNAIAQMKKQQQLQQEKATQATRAAKVPHPLASSVVASQDPCEPSDAIMVSAPVAAGIPVGAMPNSAPIANGKPPSGNTGTFLQPPSVQASGGQSTSPLMQDSNVVDGPALSPTPAANSSAPLIPQTNGISAPLALGSTTAGGLANGNSVNMNAYGLPVMPNGFPMLPNANFPNSNQLSNVAAAQLMQRMVASGTHLLINGNGTGGPQAGQLSAAQQQMIGIKNANIMLAQQQLHQQQAFNGMSSPQTMLTTQQQPAFPYCLPQMNGMATVNGNGVAMNGNGMHSGQNLMNMNGNISLKLPAQRALQLATASGQIHGQHPVKATDSNHHAVLNGVNGNHSTSPPRQQNSSSPVMAPTHGRASPSNPTRLGMPSVGRNSPHLQANGGRVSPMPVGTSPSPRMAAAGTHVPSPLASAQQLVGQQKVNGF